MYVFISFSEDLSDVHLVVNALFVYYMYYKCTSYTYVYAANKDYFYYCDSFNLIKHNV